MSFFNFFNGANNSNPAQQMMDLAPQVNWAFNTKNDRQLASSTLEFFNIGQRCGGSCLLDIPANKLQPVGFAYTIIACYMQWDSTDVNEIAAENAFYSLYRCYKETGNTFVLPALFQLLERPQYLKNRIERAHFKLVVGHSWDYLANRPPMLWIKYAKLFLITKFYDVSEHKFTIPTDLCIFTPNSREIEQLLLSFEGVELSSIVEPGENALNRIFNEIDYMIQQTR